MKAATQPTSEKTRPTAAERIATAEALRREKEAEFARNRESLWFKFWASAQRIALVKSKYPAFAEENKWELEHFHIDILKSTFYLKKLTMNQAEILEYDLRALEDKFDQFQKRQQQYAEERAVLAILRKSAIEKLTEAERLAVGLLHSTSSETYFAKPEKLTVEDRTILQAVLAKPNN